MAASSLQRRTIAIAGGGIGGLAAALALTRAGFHTIVLEKDDTPRTQGAGIQVSPNALAVLDTLGLGKRIREIASAPDAIRLNHAVSGSALGHFNLGEACRKRHGLPYLVAHRADLHTVLLESVRRGGEIDLRTGHSVADLAQHENGVTVLADHNGETREFVVGAVIGADGAGSAVRRQVSDAPEPRFTGMVAWRALVKPDAVPEGVRSRDTMLWLAPRSHTVTYPLRADMVLNVVHVTQADRAEDAPLPRGWIADRGPNQNAMERLHGPLRELLTGIETWGGWPLYHADRLGALADDRVALLGDAAHPMVPFAAQGGACALEDAAMIAACCRRHGNSFAAAFAAYSNARRRRVKRVLGLARTNGRIYHLPRPFSDARDFFLRHAPQERLQKRMDWLYGWRPPEIDPAA